MVSSVGGFVWIDFADTRKPVIRKHTFDFAKAGYCLCITDTKGSHADLTPDYVAVPTEMKQVAAYFGREVLRDVDAADFRQAIPKLRKSCSDRAILRAAHFFAENERATAEAKALENGTRVLSGYTAAALPEQYRRLFRRKRRRHTADTWMTSSEKAAVTSCLSVRWAA